MGKVEMMRVALQELGEATAEELSAFLEKSYGLKVDPKFISILKASVREKEILAESRQDVMADPAPQGA